MHNKYLIFLISYNLLRHLSIPEPHIQYGSIIALPILGSKWCNNIEGVCAILHNITHSWCQSFPLCTINIWLFRFRTIYCAIFHYQIQYYCTPSNIVQIILLYCQYCTILLHYSQYCTILMHYSQYCTILLHHSQYCTILLYVYVPTIFFCAIYLHNVIVRI